MATNPILSEIAGLSPGAKTALINAHTASAQPAATPVATQQSPQSSALIPSEPQPAPMKMQAPSSIAKPPMMGAPSLASQMPEDPGTPPKTGGLTMPTSAPQMGAPSMTNVIAPRGTLEGDQAERSRLLSSGDGISQIHSKIENSTLGKEHPFLGKLLGWGAEIPLRAAEVAGSLVGPTRIAEGFTPGTQLHHAQELRNLNSVIGDESKEGLEGTESANLQSETNLREHPRPDYKPTDTAGGIMGYDPATNSFAAPKTPSGQPEQPYDKPGPPQHVVVAGPDGKPVFANYQGGKFLDAEGKEIPNAAPYEKPDAPKETTPPHITAMLHGQAHIMERDPATGNYSIDRGVAPPSYAGMMPMVLGTKTATFIDPKTNLPVEQQYDPKTGTYDRPLGLSASNSYGHEAAQAGAVERSGNDLIQVLQDHKAQLGTLGTWVKLHGLNTPIADPTLEGIRAQLASFAALNPAMHGARGSQAMEHFENVIGGAQQNPDATIAGIQGIIRGAAQPILGQGANGGAAAGAQGEPIIQHSPSTGQYRYSTDGGKTWQQGQPPTR